MKPELVIKGGFIAGAMMGDGNASIPTPQPVIARPMFGAFGAALDACSVHFVSQAGIEGGNLAGLARRLAAVRGCRALSKKDLVLNDALPKSRSIRSRTRCAPTANCCAASRRTCCRWRSGTFCFDRSG